MLIALMMLVVAMKSRTFSSFPRSADEQVGRSWGGAQPGSQPKLGNGNIPYHRRPALLMNRSWPGGDENLLFSFPGI